MCIVGKKMEKPAQLCDVCIICALPEEARAFLEVVEQQCHITFAKCFDPEHKYNYRSATINNDRGEPLVARLKRPPSPPESGLKRRGIRCHLKAMASGSAVHADHPFEEIRVPVRGAVAIDMEGAAFGLAMSRYPQIPWLVVKGVGDY